MGRPRRSTSGRPARASGTAPQGLAETLRTSGPAWTATLAADRVLPVGLLRLWPDWTVPADELRAQVLALLGAWGVPADRAATVARHVLYADLHGIDSHGCAFLRHYQRGVAEGRLDPAAEAEVVSETGTTALLDGRGGFGHLAADAAMRSAIEKARAEGLGAVAVRNSSHFGAAGSYASMAAEAGLIGIVTTTTEDPAVVPTFGAEPRLGTNAIAIAAPGAAGPPFLLDMATSGASLGRIAVAWRRGRRIPRGWAVDRRGRPITNARAAMEARSLTPLGSSPALGSHKGYGLAAAVAVLSSVLPASDAVGHFLLAMDPARFRDDFGQGLDELTDSLRATRPLDPARPVQVAGDPERAARERRSAEGIPIPRGTIEDIRMVARASGVEFTLRPA